MKISFFSICLKVGLFLCLTFSPIAYAIDYCVLKYSDFKDENGELIPILPIPEAQVDCDGKCCKKHWGPYIRKKVRKKQSEEFIYQIRSPASEIIENGRITLKKLANIHNFDLYVPPPFFWKGTDVTKSLYYYDYRGPLMEKFVTGFFRPEIPNGRTGCRQCLSYSHFSKKYDYLEYWYDLCYELQCKRMDCILQDLRRVFDEAIKNNWWGGHYRGNYYTLRELECEIEWVRKKRSELEENIEQSSEVLRESRNEMIRLFLKIYDDCIEDHACPNSVYHRGKIAFALGDTAACIGNIFYLISNGYDLDLESLYRLGQAYSEANQYDQAIRVLSECIEKDPQNSDAYLDRAMAYFETGQFNKCLQDYLQSGMRPTYVDNDDISYLQVFKGMTLGGCRGAADSTVEFVPSLLSTLSGLGRCLWAFLGDPIGISEELIRSGMKCIEYLRESASFEFLKENMPMLMEPIERWHEIDDQQKGYVIGYATAYFGVDMLACAGSVKAVKSYRELKRANAMLTMDYAAHSNKNMQKIMKSSEAFNAQKITYTNEICKKHVGHHGKHDPKYHNFEKTRSRINIDEDYLYEVYHKNIGSGVPQRKGIVFGQANYRELYDFGETIGVHVDLKTGVETPTSIGEIHFNKKGEYHIVPVHPDRFPK